MACMSEMSDEESFVILGTSPTASLEMDGINDPKSLRKDTPPGSCFSSLKNSQINELDQARESLDKTPTRNVGVHTTSSLDVPAASHTVYNDSDLSMNTMQKSSDSLLWSRPPTQQMEKESQNDKYNPEQTVKSTYENENDFPLTLEDCAIASPTLSSNTSLNPSDNKENHRSAVNIMSNSQNSKDSKQNSMMASNFIMGEINADVLKTSVYSQFPSISMQACAEDVVKLQNMITEYAQLKSTLDKVNTTMKLFYDNSLQWKEKMNHLEVFYKQQLDDCQKQIEDLRAENTRLKKSIDEQIEQTKAVVVTRQTDREEMVQMVQKISEKTALVENMRAQIVKLEEQQNKTFEFLPKKIKEKEGESNFDSLYMTRSEHEKEIKILKRELSELLASNLDLKDMEKQYHDELTCLRHNLEEADDGAKRFQDQISQLQNINSKHHSKIDDLQKSNIDLQSTITKQNERISVLENENQNLLMQINEQNERILLLEHQNQVHKTDFEMERESRQTAVGEKQQILQDLRALQKRNQELIEEHQKYVENYEKRLSYPSPASNVNFAMNNSPLVAAAAAAQTYVNNPQRPIRDLSSKYQSPISNNPSTPPTDMYNCPVCNKGFKSLSVLTSHVNDCIDKN